MATADVTAPSPTAVSPLAEQWRSLTRLATLVALLTSPVAFVWFHTHEGLRLRYALLLTLIEVAAFRGLVDLAFRRFIPSPSLFGEELTARISLRLPESLKAAVEHAADREGVSTNAWLVRAIARAAESRPVHVSGKRLSGYAQS